MSEKRTKAAPKPPPRTEDEAEKHAAHSARPVKGPVDRKALRETIFKRFDKVIARLAE